jgi:hypothetical protein
MTLNQGPNHHLSRSLLLMKVIVFRIVIIFYLQIYNTFVIIFYILFDGILVHQTTYPLSTPMVVRNLENNPYRPEEEINARVTITLLTLAFESFFFPYSIQGFYL